MSALSISTSWNSLFYANGRDMIDEIKRAGFDSVELGFSLSEKIAKEVLDIVNDGGIRVASLHNMCPLRGDIDVKKASPDYFNFASPDIRERASAIDAARRTVDYARLFKAEAVVLHSGKVPIRDRMVDLIHARKDGRSYDKVFAAMKLERDAMLPGCLERVIESLGALERSTRESGIKLGIETRYSFRDIPLIDEFEVLFAAVPNLWYWHDTGHAEAFERLGLARHFDYLTRFSARLLGIHLHDIIGLADDHRVPLQGSFDFATLVPYVPSKVIKVLEAHQPSTKDEIVKAREYLESLFR